MVIHWPPAAFLVQVPEDEAAGARELLAAAGEPDQNHQPGEGES